MFFPLALYSLTYAIIGKQHNVHPNPRQLISNHEPTFRSPATIAANYQPFMNSIINNYFLKKTCIDMLFHSNISSFQINIGVFLALTISNCELWIQWTKQSDLLNAINFKVFSSCIDPELSNKSTLYFSSLSGPKKSWLTN